MASKVDQVSNVLPTGCNKVTAGVARVIEFKSRNAPVSDRRPCQAISRSKDRYDVRHIVVRKCFSDVLIRGD
jgi:hypothetical protein